jgi:hypothetical protein
MFKQKPLWERLYQEAEFYQLAREVGYAGCTFRQYQQKIDELAKTYDRQKLESAGYHLVTYEGQMTVKPKPLANVQLRAEVRKLCWQLLGCPPGHRIPSIAEMLGPAPHAVEEPKTAKKPPRRAKAS